MPAHQRAGSSAAAQWSWHQFPDTWTAYDEELSAQLERALTTSRTPAVEVQLGPQRTRYRIDLNTMEQINLSTNFSRAVRREPTAAMRGTAAWWWDGGSALGWTAYDEQAAQQLELAHRANRSVTGLMVGGQKYVIDFVRMSQQNVRTQFRRQIHRAVGTAGPPNTAAAAAAPHAAPPARRSSRKRGGAQPAPPPKATRTPRGRVGGDDAMDAEDRIDEEIFFESHEGQLDIALMTDWRLLRPGDGYDPAAECPITCCEYGADADDPVVKLSCGCIFNQSTTERALVNKPQCPLCHYKFALPGAQPTGSMAVSRDPFPCEGNAGAGTIVIRYDFASGRQGPQHPQPGAPYHGTQRECYLPNTADGRRTLRLLKEAFQRGLTFKIATSITTGRANTVTWAIHHKTSRAGGTERYGWPDPGYYERCAAECAALGLMLDDDGRVLLHPPEGGGGSSGGGAAAAV